jgi:hypothetical protein
MHDHDPTDPASSIAAYRAQACRYYAAQATPGDTAGKEVMQS